MAKELDLENFEKTVAATRQRLIAAAPAIPNNDFKSLSDCHANGFRSACGDFKEKWQQSGFECTEGTTTLNAKTHQWDFNPSPGPRASLTTTRSPMQSSTAGHDQPDPGQADDTLRHEWVTVHKDSQFDDHDMVDMSAPEGDHREQRGTEHEELDGDGEWVVYS